MIDVMDIKLKVIQAACGITALGEAELLQRLEKLYLEGMEAGAQLLKDRTVELVNAESISPQAPIARVIVHEDGPTTTSLYAPGLPPGEHDLYCQPEAIAPYLRDTSTLNEASK